MKTTPFIPKRDFGDYLNTEMREGYEEGLHDKPYSGQSWHGLYAWMSAQKGEKAPKEYNKEKKREEKK